MSSPLFQLEHISKSFPGVTANDDVSLNLWEGQIHAVIGENGAGKSTLMGIVFGIHQPDSGRILHHGSEIRIADPAAAIALGIVMVTQHTTMIPALTALENVILGCEPGGPGGVIAREKAESELRSLSDRLSVKVDWNAEAESLSVAALQKAEIVKALYRGARVLILDEPTATLAPQEAESLFALMHSLVADGVTVVFVTHKLREVLSHSDRVTVLRAGRVVGERITAQTYSEELLSMMLGRTTASTGVPLTDETPAMPPAAWERGPESEMLAPSPLSASSPAQISALSLTPCLEVQSLTVLNRRGAPAVRNVGLTVMSGESVGVAGVDGSGQSELARAIIGLTSASSGRILLGGEDITRRTVSQRRREGIAYIPEDRHREGLVLDFTIAENVLLGNHRHSEFGGGSRLNLPKIAARGDAVVGDHRIRAAGGDVAARTLSGGNQQKVVVARALESRPRLLVAMQPTRGLDVDATRFIYSAIKRECAAGMALLLFSLDLDEIFELCDRIAVLFSGEIVAVAPRGDVTPEGIGRLMLEGRP
jgi:simple sugar transport system ATP-binding protein